MQSAFVNVRFTLKRGHPADRFCEQADGRRTYRPQIRGNSACG